MAFILSDAVKFDRLIALVLGVFCSAVGFSKDYFLTIAGGPEVYQNQVSLEKNVSFFERILNRHYDHEKFEHTVLFSDGKDLKPDLQYIKQSAPESEVNRYLTEIFLESDYVPYGYRTSHFSRSVESASLENLSSIFSRYEKSLKENDRLFIYLTGHGGKSRVKNIHNTRFFLWGSTEEMTVKRLTQYLDRLDSRIQVTIFGMQCYSGGFGRYMFQGGNESKPLSAQRRVGFFSTHFNRLADGCWANPDESAYDDYGTHFLSAVHNESRMGQAIERPDYDGDGKVTLLEAHAFAMVMSHSIDRGVSTSDIFLYRLWNRQKNTKSSRLKRLLRRESLRQLRPFARKDQFYILERIAETFSSPRNASVSHLSKELVRLKREAEKLKSDIMKASLELNRIRNSVLKHAVGHFPTLRHPWHPETLLLISQYGDHVLAILRLAPSFLAYQERQEILSRLRSDLLEKKRFIAKIDRFFYVLGSIYIYRQLLAGKNLPESKEYRLILEGESQVLGEGN